MKKDAGTILPMWVFLSLPIHSSGTFIFYSDPFLFLIYISYLISYLFLSSLCAAYILYFYFFLYFVIQGPQELLDFILKAIVFAVSLASLIYVYYY